MIEKSPRKGVSPIPATKRMAAMRERKRKAGLSAIEVWAHPDDHKAIREYAETLTKARDQAANAKLTGAARADD